MPDQFATRFSRIFLVLGSTVEAVDLIDFFERRVSSPVIQSKTPEAALALVPTFDKSKDLVVFGLDRKSFGADRCLHEIHSTGVPLVLINGSASAARQLGAIFLSRPYTDTDVDQALRAATAISGA